MTARHTDNTSYLSYNMVLASAWHMSVLSFITRYRWSRERLPASSYLSVNQIHCHPAFQTTSLSKNRIEWIFSNVVYMDNAQNMLVWKWDMFGGKIKNSPVGDCRLSLQYATFTPYGCGSGGRLRFAVRKTVLSVHTPAATGAVNLRRCRTWLSQFSNSVTPLYIEVLQYWDAFIYECRQHIPGPLVPRLGLASY